MYQTEFIYSVLTQGVSRAIPWGLTKIHTKNEIVKKPLSIRRNHRLKNHSMVELGRDLWISLDSTPLLKQGHLQQAAQDLVQAGLGYLQRRRIHNLPGQPVPGLRQPQSKEVLPQVQTELPMLQFEPVAPCPVTGHHWKESGRILLIPTLQIFISIY